jgi:dolichyl-phosphate beta-glucosyltransferase
MCYGHKTSARRRLSVAVFSKRSRENPLYVGFWDADLATPLDALPLCEEVLRDRPVVEIVLGARVTLLGRDIRRRPLRHYLGRTFAMAVVLTLGLKVYDSQCGAKLCRASNTVRVLFDTPFLSRWIFDVEILARFKRLRQTGVPTTVEQSIYELALPVWHDVPGSKLSLVGFRDCRS